MGQLYINDTLMDVSDKTVIAITRQINDVGSIEKVKGDTTNQFKLPKTLHNLNVLGLPGDINLSEKNEYKLLPAKYVEDGVELIPKGFATIEAVNEFIECKVLSGNVEFFDLLEGNINELELPGTDHVWNGHTITMAMGNTTGFIYPIVDYGLLPDNSMDVDYQHMRPAIFCSTIIDAIISRAGFTKAGRIFNDPDYLAEIIPLPDGLKQPDNSKFDFTAKVLSLQRAEHGEYFKVTLVDETENPVNNEGGHWDNANNWYVFEKSATAKFKIKLRIASSSPSEKDFKLGLRMNGEVITYEFIGGTFQVPKFFASETVKVKWPDTNEISIESDFMFFPADTKVEVWGWREKGSPMGGSFVLIVPSDDSQFTLEIGDALYRSEISIAKSLPDISVKDFFKSWMHRYCLLANSDTVNKVIHLNSFDELEANIPRAKDWSDKVTGETDELTFTFSSYAKNNHFKYKEDENVPVESGQGTLTIQDETLENNKDIVTLPFAATTMTAAKLNGLAIASINKIDPTNTDDNGNIKPEYRVKTQPRLLRIYRKDMISAPIRFFDPPNGIVTLGQIDVPLTYFYLDGLRNLDFKSLLTDKYKQLSVALHHAQVINTTLKLNNLDIEEFDHLIPVFIRKYSRYFYVNKISNYIDGQLTKVQLIRI
ncbi:hypothetical protein DJ568_15490 [Mucilaginibacter hurinus]|uniref:Uncharacterized protein n=1 Tax=Mucilaginibacter hurinus TaxID=2201324 RepID=A0A367GMM7_9SPHI|nr:hypothetical protein [Mucilaginibacter hurinus]RCH53941.1 hypothetical protein DJ568_15490 [Mucilaginibacter hurinus]